MRVVEGPKLIVNFTGGIANHCLSLGSSPSFGYIFTISNMGLIHLIFTGHGPVAYMCSNNFHLLWLSVVIQNQKM